MERKQRNQFFECFSKSFLKQIMDSTKSSKKINIFLVMIKKSKKSARGTTIFILTKNC